MNLAEMFATTGGKLFYGGIMGAAASIILAVVFIPVFAYSKKRLIKKINAEYSDKK